MKSFLDLAKASIAFSLLFLLLLGLGATAVAQLNPPGVPKSNEITTNDPYLPLVYNVENTGASYPSPAFPPFANLPIVRPLPDPFVYLSNGQRDTSFAGWEQHRSEILSAFENYMVGPKPDCSDCTITASYATTSANHYTLTINIARPGQTTLKMTSAIVTPAGTPPAGGWPYAIGVDGAPGSFFPAATFPTIATVVFTSSQITTSSNNNATGASPDPFFKLYADMHWCVFNCTFLPANGTSYNGTVGQFQAWSWGISRLIDGIQMVATQASNPLPLDTTHSGITGCSYAGKIALYGGALDERIALTVSEENGGGGVPSWRHSYNTGAESTIGSHNGSIEDMDTTDHHWWAAGVMQYQFSGPDVYKLPIDLHEIAALVAPRALVETGNTNSYWLANESNYVSSRAIQQVYNTFGIGNRFGFIVDGNHGHCAPPASEIASVGQFIKRFMLGQNVSTDVEVYPAGQPTDGFGTSQNPKHYYPVNFATMDHQRWYNWWGTGNPQFQNSWNTGGTTDLWFNNPVILNTGDTVQAGYDITMSAVNHPAATVQINNANIQTDVTCSDGSSYVLYIPLAKKSYTIPASDNSWYPSDDPTNSATYQGSTTVAPLKLALGSTINQGCSNGQPGQATRTYLTAFGVQDNANGDPAGPGFVTSDTTKSPLVVRFHLADTTTGDGGGWGPAVTVNQLPTN